MSAMETHINNIKLAIDRHKPLTVEVMSFELPISRELSNFRHFMEDLTLIVGLLTGHQVNNLIVKMECNHEFDLFMLWDSRLRAFLTLTARLFSSMELCFNRYQYGSNISLLFAGGDNETKRDWSRAVAELA
ncbi:hypothetical protein PRIPAC_82262 [Pristionchus pacificus]|uniref:Uncharacterized protein n=1 Tax=Pristionchus pacificus TaxID=54126 RepID=A0A2A6BH20_PRIPA|nr:hypothetical protein PRIPAC_82262 [Pristionchus pacificus]|eukprot:PDM65179.1 hypothetical protein PRIPAC_52121 [Pristionchus pacificus]